MYRIYNRCKLCHNIFEYELKPDAESRQKCDVCERYAHIEVNQHEPSVFAAAIKNAFNEIDAPEYKAAIKHDAGKLPWELLPFDALEEIVKVLQHGAGKYGARNWEKGFSWSRIMSALFRHAVAFWRGEDYDPESRLLHTAHLGCCVLFILAHQLRKIGTDDRPKEVHGKKTAEED